MTDGTTERASRSRSIDERDRQRRIAAKRKRQARQLADSQQDDNDDREERPRAGVKRSLMQTIRQIPRYVRLLLGLMRDSRVSRIDRLMVLGALAYIISPLDFIPDLVPFLGQVDDIFLLMVALQRLVDRAGQNVLLDHWSGHPRELSDLNMARVVTSASFFLPGKIQRRLRAMAR